ncbi:DUF1802 family protein [Anabaenopsis elenkinii]|uniref:DUF1802 family protein n=1 Tax=Anabaenopsis elenkinii CCIBt3563 TaxID=2779889 RepID=A0A7S6TZI2_9CYAN|nr:DUF1802 family protein [Anabaenopsis elenkinii]QOV22950.1 DUF1802 family protein [Anabaenopsis elenkinii CCIBt3563]
MSQSVLIYKALCLPSGDVEALVQGRIIAAIPRKLLNRGDKFALYPVNSSIHQLRIEQYYRPDFLPIAQSVIKQVNSEKVTIKAWARCELCRMLDETQPLEVLSQLTIWTTATLKQILEQQHIFLAYLRVYHLSEPCQVALTPDIKGKIGKFLGIPNITAAEAKPVLSDRIFAQRQKQLENLEPPKHPELEDLQSAIVSLSMSNPGAQALDNDIKRFLGWSSREDNYQPNEDLGWINNIAALGDRSIQQDEGKSNYQAGTDFENVVRHSLEFLGFTVDYSHKGGAGGLDLFCSQPYPLFGECKAGKRIPNDSAVQLLNLGMLREPELFYQATKIIIGPGKPTNQLQKSAKTQGMAILNPETLEKLVKLQNNYPNSVDLFKLKEYLKPGQCDAQVEKYINQLYRDINLRSHIIQLVKNYQQNSGIDLAGVEALHGAYFGSQPSQPLQPEEMYEILIELSSPLTGYLGRVKGQNWKSDRFYFLRELATTTE